MKKSVLIFTFATMFGFAAFVSVGQTPVRQTETQQQQDQKDMDQHKQTDQQKQQDLQKQQDQQQQQQTPQRQNEGMRQGQQQDQQRQNEGMRQGQQYDRQTATTINVTELPQAVQKAAKDSNKDANIESAEKKVLPNGETVYKVKFSGTTGVAAGSDNTRMFYADGHEYYEKKDTANAIEVSELPQAVQKAAKDLHKTANIESAERKVLPTGETVYKVTFDSNNIVTGEEETKMFYANGREYEEEEDTDDNDIR